VTASGSSGCVSSRRWPCSVSSLSSSTTEGSAGNEQLPTAFPTHDAGAAIGPARQGAARSIKGGLEYAMFNDAISEPALDRAAGGRYGRRPAAGGRYGRRPAAGGRRGRGSEELDALRQRQLAGVVDRVRGLPH